MNNPTISEEEKVLEEELRKFFDKEITPYVQDAVKVEIRTLFGEYVAGADRARLELTSVVDARMRSLAETAESLTKIAARQGESLGNLNAALTSLNEKSVVHDASLVRMNNALTSFDRSAVTNQTALGELKTVLSSTTSANEISRSFLADVNKALSSLSKNSSELAIWKTDADTAIKALHDAEARVAGNIDKWGEGITTWSGNVAGAITAWHADLEARFDKLEKELPATLKASLGEGGITIVLPAEIAALPQEFAQVTTGLADLKQSIANLSAQINKESGGINEERGEKGLPAEPPAKTPAPVPAGAPAPVVAPVPATAQSWRARLQRDAKTLMAWFSAHARNLWRWFGIVLKSVGAVSLLAVALLIVYFKVNGHLPPGFSDAPEPIAPQQINASLKTGTISASARSNAQREHAYEISWAVLRARPDFAPFCKMNLACLLKPRWDASTTVERMRLLQFALVALDPQNTCRIANDPPDGLKIDPKDGLWGSATSKALIRANACFGLKLPEAELKIKPKDDNVLFGYVGVVLTHLAPAGAPPK